MRKFEDGTVLPHFAPINGDTVEGVIRVPNVVNVIVNRWITTLSEDLWSSAVQCSPFFAQYAWQFVQSYVEIATTFCVPPEIGRLNVPFSLNLTEKHSVFVVESLNS